VRNCAPAAGLGQFGGEIELAGPGGIFLADHLPLEIRLDAGGNVFAGGIVGIDQKQRLDALLIEIFAGRLRGLVALPGDRKEVRRALFAGNLRGPGIGADDEGLRIHRRQQRGQQHVGKAVAGEKIDVVGFDELVGLLLADLGLLRVVLEQNLDRLSRHLAAEMLEAEIEAVAHVVADRGGRAAERPDEADFHTVSRHSCRCDVRRGQARQGHDRDCKPRSRFTHVSSRGALFAAPSHELWVNMQLL
jgi:hypothetical protein